MSTIQWAADIVVYANLAAALLFMLQYQIVSRGQWIRSQTGISLMALAVVHTLIFGMLTLAHAFSWLAAQVWYQWWYVATVGSISVVIVSLGYRLWRVNQPRGRGPAQRW